VRKSRFTEAQIVAILKELDAGAAATELLRRHGIHATVRQWRDKYAGLDQRSDAAVATRGRERTQGSGDRATHHGGGCGPG